MAQASIPVLNTAPFLGVCLQIFSPKVCDIFSLCSLGCAETFQFYTILFLYPPWFFFFFSGFTVLNLVFESLFLPDFYIWCMMRVKFHSSACSYSQHLLVKTLTFSPLHVLGPLVEKSVHCKCGGCFWSLGAVLMDDVSTSAPALCLFSR